MKVILIRHLTTDWNTLKRIQGHKDIELSEGGRKEAREFAHKLKGLGVKCIVSSDLKRSTQTAEIVSDVLEVSFTTDSRIREASFGSIEGMTRAEAIEVYGDDVKKDWDDNSNSFDFTRFGGEHRDHVLKRHLEFLRDLPHICPEGPILLVGHGRGFMTLLGHLGLEPELRRGEYREINV